jgi:hypothetical protein
MTVSGQVWTRQAQKEIHQPDDKLIGKPDRN